MFVGCTSLVSGLVARSGFFEDQFVGVVPPLGFGASGTFVALGPCNNQAFAATVETSAVENAGVQWID